MERVRPNHYQQQTRKRGIRENTHSGSELLLEIFRHAGGESGPIEAPNPGDKASGSPLASKGGEEQGSPW